MEPPSKVKTDVECTNSCRLSKMGLSKVKVLGQVQIGHNLSAINKALDVFSRIIYNAT
jgi:hypothetical protein